MTTVQRDAIATPATGLQVYNTTTNENNTYNGSAWVGGGSNIYTADGTLTGNRTVTSGGFNLTFTGSNTATSAIARGLNLTHTLVAAANNDVLVGLDINATFNNGGFSGFKNIPLRIKGTTDINFFSSGNIGVNTLTESIFKIDVVGDVRINGIRIGLGVNGLATNCGVGQNVLNGANSGGANNSAFGNSSMNKNTTGAFNAAFGSASLVQNTTGSLNAAFGVSALENVVGGLNSAFGASSLTNITTGSSNVAIGNDAGRFAGAASTALTSVNNSIYVGYRTRSFAATGITNEIVIGYDVVGLGSNTTIIGNGSTITTAIRGRLLLGTTTDSGSYQLDVNGTARVSGDFTIADTKNIILATGTGTKIGTATTEKLSFWNATPIVQPTTGIAEAAFVENLGGSIVNVDSTFDGYTMQQVVKALRNMGALA
jgi:hypothetical protein